MREGSLFSKPPVFHAHTHSNLKPRGREFRYLFKPILHEDLEIE